MCGCEKHRDKAAECTCLCKAHRNFELALRCLREAGDELDGVAATLDYAMDRLEAVKALAESRYLVLHEPAHALAIEVLGAIHERAEVIAERMGDEDARTPL